MRADYHEILGGGGTAGDRLQAVLSLKVCDPAMGSGHFLVEAFDRLIQAVRGLAEEDPELDPAELQRALIVRRCLYGVDLNPMAVEIARMVLWIRTFRPDRPLEFFDANLKCGNSLVGSVEAGSGQEAPSQRGLFANAADWEREVSAELSREVLAVLDLPSATIDQVRAKEQRYRERVQPLLKDAAFIEHARLLRQFHPGRWPDLEPPYESVLRGIAGDRRFLRKLLAPGQLPSLFPDDAERGRTERLVREVIDLRQRLRPVHWPLEFPHVFQDGGGFDVVLGNPPWDTVTTDFRDFFSDYIPGFADLETKDAKAAGEALLAASPAVAAAHAAYTRSVEDLNGYVGAAYEHQVATDERGKRTKKGDNNLYKLFIERAWKIMSDGGRCGFVVPSGLNSDSGCTGLRRLLLREGTVEELIMLDNRRGLFPDVARAYKFDLLTVQKRCPHRRHRFTSGFYWADPRWLAGEGDPQDRETHQRFSYPIHLSEALAPDTLSLIEMRSAADIPVLEKLAAHPLLGDARQEWHGETYAEFHMTGDSDLFNTEGRGYPLLEGKCIHQYDASFAPPTRWVVSGEGESRLAARWKCPPEELPDRQFRLACRAIARGTDQRTLIAALLPLHVFCGNSLNLVETRGLPLREVLGVLAVLNSLTLDFLLRLRVNMNVNAFYVKQLPVPRDRKALAALGELVRPLLAGRDLDDARGGAAAITDPAGRSRRRAEIDAHVARLYGLTYEELQHVTRQFPIVARQEPGYLEEVLRKYRLLA